MSEQPILTAQGAARLKAELEKLKGIPREELAQRLRSAVQQGICQRTPTTTRQKKIRVFWKVASRNWNIC